MDNYNNEKDILKVHKFEQKRVLLMRGDNLLMWCELYYTLVSFECDDGRIYGIDVRSENEDALGFIGDDAEISEQIFTLVVKNSITPLTLKDVLHDIGIELLDKNK